MLPKTLHSALLGSVLILTGCGIVATAVLATRATQADEKTKSGRKADASAARGQAEDSPSDAASHAKQEEKKRHALTLGAKLHPKQIEVLEIASLDENSLAAKAGLRQKDRILSADGQEVSSPRQLDAYLASQAGRRVPLLVERDGRQMVVPVVPSELAGDTAWLGVFLEQGESKDKGARITHVYPSGPAARAGLHVGDTILKVNDHTIEHPADLIELVQELDPDAKADFRWNVFPGRQGWRRSRNDSERADQCKEPEHFPSRIRDGRRAGGGFAR